MLSNDLGCVTKTASLLDEVNQRWVTGGGKNRTNKVTLEKELENPNLISILAINLLPLSRCFLI